MEAKEKSAVIKKRGHACLIVGNNELCTERPLFTHFTLQDKNMILPKIKPDDVALYYEVHGEGAPLLLVAGLGSDCSSWGRIVKNLSAHFEVIVLDNRGAGRSEIPDRRYTIGQMAGDAIRVLDHLKVKEAHILGHSMGGYIAQELAIDHSGRVGRLILEGTAPVSSERNNRLFLKFYEGLRQGENSEAWYREWTRWLFSPGWLRRRKAFIEAFVKNGANYPYAQPASGFKGQIDAIASFDARERLGRITAKTLIMEGREDILIPPGEAEALAEKIPGSVFQRVNDAAHCIHIENPGLFVKAVTGFLNSEFRK